MKDADLTRAVWRKSSFSNGQAECVEMADLPGGGQAVRDSKVDVSPILLFAGDEWRAFISGAKRGADNL